MMGTVIPEARASRTSFNTVGVLTPLARATLLADWIVGPSAIGSVKGMPSSMISAPPSCRARRIGTVSSTEG